MKLNERIEAWRIHVGMSVAALADRVGVVWESAYQWTTGKTEPTHRNLLSIVEAFGLSMAQFWGAVPSPSPTKRSNRKRKAA